MELGQRVYQPAGSTMTCVFLGNSQPVRVSFLHAMTADMEGLRWALWQVAQFCGSAGL